MTVKTFFYGLIASFGLPWLIILVIPFSTMRSLESPRFDEVNDESTAIYHPTRGGRITNGSLIYGQEGCAMCHSQLTRPSYAGNDVFREGQGGTKKDPDRGDTRRITNAWDFIGEERAHIGETRIGPDLGNFGNRLDVFANEENIKLATAEGIELEKDGVPLTPADVASALGDMAFDKELYVYKHLYNPRQENPVDKSQEKHWSVCQSNPQFFTKRGNHGQGAVDAVDIKCGQQVVPNDSGRAIVSYLINLKKDGAIPYAMQYTKEKKKAGAK